jgi:hypothetical protein
MKNCLYSLHNTYQLKLYIFTTKLIATASNLHVYFCQLFYLFYFFYHLMTSFLSNIVNLKRYQFALMCAVLVILTYGFSSEKILVENGFGWDGRAFGNFTLNVMGHLQRHLIDPYRFQRLAVPFFINIVFRVCHISFTDANVLNAYLIFNATCITIAMCYYFKIVQLLKLPTSLYLIGFAALFFCFPILKLSMFYPVLMDIPAFLIGVMLVYYYLKQSSTVAFILILVGSFVYPTFILFSILFVFKQQPILSNENSITTNTNKWIVKIYNTTTMASVVKLVLPIVFAIVCFVLFYRANFITIIQAFQVNFWQALVTFISFLIGIIYLFYLSISCKFSLNNIYKSLHIKPALLALLVLFIVKFIIVALSSNVAPVLTFKLYLLNICTQVVQNPASFIVAHIYYYGPMFLMLLFFINKIKAVVLNYGFGMLFFMYAVFFFSVGSESRQLINYYPFLVLITLVALHKYYVVSNVFAILFAVFSLFFSHFWFVINNQTIINKGFVGNDATQRYFMFHGPWVSNQSYIQHALVCMLLALLLFTALNKSLFITQKTAQ